jgi:hypothetical protein
MTAFPSYSIGTVAVAASATTIIGTGTIWSGVNVRPGDDIVIAGHTVVVLDVTDTTHLVIDAWPYTTVAAGASYKVIQRSPLRFAGGQAMADVSTMISLLNNLDAVIFSFEGDSLTDTTDMGTWPLKLATQSAFFSRGIKNYFGTDGDRASAMVGQYASQAGAVAILPGMDAYYFLWAGSNDVKDSVAAATIYGYLTTMWAAARISGYKVVAFTIMPRVDFDSTRETIRLALNALIRSDPTLYDFLVTPDTLFTIPGGVNFLADGVHLTATGNVLVANAVVSTVLGIAPATPSDAAANIAVNAGGEVSQELGITGLTLVNSAAHKYVADCWAALYNNAAAVITCGQVAAASFPSPLAGFPFGIRMKATTAVSSIANGDYATIYTPIEGYRVAHLGWGAAGALTLAYGFNFYSTIAGVLCISFNNAAGDRNYYKQHTVNAGWNWLSGTVPGDTGGTWNNTTGFGLFMNVYAAGKDASPQAPDGGWVSSLVTSTPGSTNLLANANNTVIVTGLVLVAGKLAPAQVDAPRLMQPLPVELNTCQRYYEKSFNYATAPAQNAGTGLGESYLSATAAGAASNRLPSVYWNTRKRVAPTITLYNPSAANAQVRDATASADCSGSTPTASGESNMIMIATGNAATAVGNRLAVHWVADARL